jgi:hypothetical protein
LSESVHVNVGTEDLPDIFKVNGGGRDVQPRRNCKEENTEY